MALGRGILVDFWVIHEVESCNFQNLLVFGFPESSQNFISFRQLLFSLFQIGAFWKNLKTPKIYKDDLVLAWKKIVTRFRIRENMWWKFITRQMAQSTSTAPFKSPNNYENRDEFKTPKQTTSPFNQPPTMMKSRSQRRLLVEGNYFS